jgi:hypothetical protein
LTVNADLAGQDERLRAFARRCESARDDKDVEAGLFSFGGHERDKERQCDAQPRLLVAREIDARTYARTEV